MPKNSVVGYEHLVACVVIRVPVFVSGDATVAIDGIPRGVVDNIIPDRHVVRVHGRDTTAATFTDDIVYYAPMMRILCQVRVRISAGDFAVAVVGRIGSLSLPLSFLQCDVVVVTSNGKSSQFDVGGS